MNVFQAIYSDLTVQIKGGRLSKFWYYLLMLVALVSFSYLAEEVYREARTLVFRISYETYGPGDKFAQPALSIAIPRANGSVPVIARVDDMKISAFDVPSFSFLNEGIEADGFLRCTFNSTRTGAVGWIRYRLEGVSMTRCPDMYMQMRKNFNTTFEVFSIPLPSFRHVDDSVHFGFRNIDRTRTYPWSIVHFDLPDALPDITFVGSPGGALLHGAATSVHSTVHVPIGYDCRVSSSQIRVEQQRTELISGTRKVEYHSNVNNIDYGTCDQSDDLSLEGGLVDVEVSAPVRTVMVVSEQHKLSLSEALGVLGGLWGTCSCIVFVFFPKMEDKVVVKLRSLSCSSQKVQGTK